MFQKGSLKKAISLCLSHYMIFAYLNKDTEEPYKPAVTKKKKKKLKKRKNAEGSDRPIGRPRKKIKTEDGEKPGKFSLKIE